MLGRGWITGLYTKSGFVVKTILAVQLAFSLLSRKPSVVSGPCSEYLPARRVEWPDLELPRGQKPE